METKLFRHFDVDGNELPSTEIEISDEELQREVDEARLKEILAMGHSAIPLPLLTEAFCLLYKRLGI